MLVARTWCLSALAVLFTAQVASAQIALDQLPECSFNCLVEGISTSTCSPVDSACTCADTTLQTTVQTCVLSNCTVKEGLQLKNLTMTNCGAPVRDRSSEYKLLSNILGSVAAGFVFQRFAYKIFVKIPLGLDDWLTMATMLSIIPSMVINAHGVNKAGLGRDLWTLRPEQITDFGRYFYLLAIFYFTQVALLKLAMLFFYKRIFPSKRTQLLLLGTVVFDIIFGISYVLLVIFQCRPISHFWQKWDGEHEGTCLDINGITWSNAVTSIALDIWMLAIPLWHLHGLQLDWKKKIGVALMFGVGTFVTIVSALRLRSLIDFGKDSSNISWSYVEVSIWSTIEITVGIICVCMPTMRLILVRTFPKIFATTKTYYARYGGSSGDRSANRASRWLSHSRMGSSGVVDRPRLTPSYPMREMRDPFGSSDRSDRDDKESQNIILHQTTITVEYEGMDEEKLVRPNPQAYGQNGRERWNQF